MTDKEILAELKRSYEYLNDILENGCIDRDSEKGTPNIDSLKSAMNDIEDVYYNFYNTLDKEDLRVKLLEDRTNGNKVYINRCVDGDYEVGNNCMTVADLCYIWYDDEKFLRK